MANHLLDAEHDAGRRKQAKQHDTRTSNSNIGKQQRTKRNFRKAGAEYEMQVRELAGAEQSRHVDEAVFVDERQRYARLEQFVMSCQHDQLETEQRTQDG